MELDFECLHPQARLVCRIPSDRRLVEETVEKCTDFVQNHRTFRPIRFRVVLRELLINAIEHGNASDPKRHVTCSVTIGERGDCVHLCIEDEGEGFSYRDLNMSLSENARTMTNRGYRLIGNLSRRLGFNEKGNRVSVCVGENGADMVACSNGGQ